MWKFGNVEICLEHSYVTRLGSLEIWKCGNIEIYISHHELYIEQLITPDNYKTCIKLSISPMN